MDIGNGPIILIQLKDITPPKRTTEDSGMGNHTIIIRVPNQGDSRDINFVAKLVQMLNQQALILNMKIVNAKTTLSLGLQTKSHAAKDYLGVSEFPSIGTASQCFQDA